MKNDPFSIPFHIVEGTPEHPRLISAIGPSGDAMRPIVDVGGTQFKGAVNFNPNHDELGRFTTAGSTGILDAKYGFNLLTMQPNPPPVFDARTERNIATLLPPVQDLARQHLYEARKAGIDLRITDGSRTYAQQDELYAKGRTEPGPIVTNARGGHSNHNFGLAYDVGVFTDNGKHWIEDGPLYDVAAAVGKRLGLEWGGDFESPVDRPHFQYRTGLTPSSCARGSPMASRLSPINDMRLLLLIALFAGLASHAAASDYFSLPAYVLKIEDLVRVNKAAVKTTKELLTGTDGGGEMTIYSKAGRPAEVIVSIFVSRYESIQTFIYDKGTLMLVIDRERFFEWDPKTGTVDPGKTGKLEEERSYFKNGDLVYWLTMHDTLSDEGDGPPIGGKTPAAEKLRCLRDSAYFLNVATSKEKSVDVAAFIKG